MSEYQKLKLTLVDTTGVSRDGFHIILGFLVFLVCAKIFKTKINSFASLIAPIVFALAMEVKDALDTIQLGRAIDYPDATQDIILTTMLPIITVLYFRFIEKKF